MTQSNTSSSVQVGPGLFGLCVLATIALAVLKIVGVLAVSWLVVLLPVIIGGALTVAALIIGVVLLIIAARL